MKYFLGKSKYLPFLLLLAVTALLFITNYKAGTFLTGWDNLHPEYNFGVNIQRSIFAVWQEYQGLGLLAGMAHASDLVHQIFLLILSPIIPLNLLRYFYQFFMVFLGLTGIYVFLSHFVLAEKDEKTRKIFSLVGSLSYLLNLGTIQYFFVPFEPYSTFYGFFPWELFVVFQYLKNPNKKNLLILALVNLLATPQAYVQTIFLVYLLCLAVVLAFHTLVHKKRIASLKALAVVLLINSFWLLPNLYFVIHNLSVTQNAMQNQMATEKFFEMNKRRGNILDFALLRDFYYDFFD